MINDLETFATRLSAEWREDVQSGDCPMEQWLDRFELPFLPPEPDTCADGVTRLPSLATPIRWYDDDGQVLGFREGNHCYAIPWREIDVFLRGFDTCEDDEFPVWDQTMPLAG